MKSPISFVAVMLLVVATGVVGVAHGETIPFDSEQWLKPRAEVVDHDGRQSLMGFAYLKDVEFENGRRNGKPFGRAFGEPDRTPEAGEYDLGTLFLGDPRRVPRNRIVGEHAGNDQPFSIQHAAVLPLRVQHPRARIRRRWTRPGIRAP